MTNDLRQRLTAEIDFADWQDLLPHFARQRVFACRDGLALLDAATAVALDDVDTIRKWIFSGLLHTPDDEQATRWLAAKAVFRFVIIQPYVLVKIREVAEA